MLRQIWYDNRIRAWCLQGLLLAAAVGGLGWLAANAQANLARRGIASGFGFLDQIARFPISESVIAYQPSDTFGRAFAAGIANTVFISVLVIVVSTVLGLGLALARRSPHPLVHGAATVYLEVMRNTPLVVQLLFWYALLTLALPPARQALSPLPGVFLSVRGLFLPRVLANGDTAWAWLGAGVAAALLVGGLALHAWRQGRGAPPRPVRRTAIALALMALAAGMLAGGVTPRLELPHLRGLNFTGGTHYTPEFTALLVGLTLYSAAFSGEILRGGIAAVPAGQWEAGESLGLRRGRILRSIVFPQALRVIVPPMTSQYLSITKNSTLALAVGYPDLSFVVATTINQTGQAVEGILILMGVFLAISLGVSLLMNLYNRHLLRTQA